MIKENKYYLLIRVFESPDEEIYYLEKKADIGLLCKSYFFDVMLSTVNLDKKISILVLSRYFYECKYIQCFGGTFGSYFSSQVRLPTYDLSAFSIDNFQFYNSLMEKNSAIVGVRFNLNKDIRYDASVDSVSLIEDIHFSERFFVGFQSVASNFVGNNSPKNEMFNSSSQLGLISKKRSSAEDFQSLAPNESVIANLFQELQLLNRPVALAGGICPFHYFELDLINGALKIDRVVKGYQMPVGYWDIAFNQQLSKRNAGFVLLITASLYPLVSRYGARAKRYVDLEAGAITHAISLFCAEKEIPCRVIGGFDDVLVSRELRLDENDLFPVVALFIGMPSEKI